MKTQNPLDLITTDAQSPNEQAEQIMILEPIKRGIDAKIKLYKEQLLQMTQEKGVFQLKTGKYTLSRCKRVTPRVVDFDELKKALAKAKIPYGTKEVFADYMSAVFKQAIEEGMELDGLEKSETEYIMIRIPKKEKKLSAKELARRGDRE